MAKRFLARFIILAVIFYLLIYIFINVHVIGLGEIKKISDNNKNRLHNSREKVSGSERLKDQTRISFKYHLSSKHFEQGADIKNRLNTVKKKNEHDADIRNNEHDADKGNSEQDAVIENNVHDAVIGNNKHDADIRNSEHDSVIENNEHDAVIGNNKHDPGIRKSEHDAVIDNNVHDAVIKNNKPAAVMRNNYKHKSVVGNNDEHAFALRNNNGHDSLRRPIFSNDSFIHNHKTKTYFFNETTKRAIRHNSTLDRRRINGSLYLPLQFIPTNVFQSQRIVPYISQNVTERFLTLPETKYTQVIAIVSPIRNSEWSLDTFMNQLINLSYPHHLIAVYFGESGSSDNTFDKATNISKVLRTVHDFRHSEVIRLHLSGGIQGSNKYRHKKIYQKQRRSHIAVVRNRLVQYVLGHEKYDQILSMDSDLTEFPSDLLQQMLFAKSDVVVTPCLAKFHDIKFIYDCNSWRETKASLKKQKLLEPDDLVLECYGSYDRIFLSYLKREGRIVKLDGVGGCALMIRTECFRSGLRFPDIVYKHHIETEGLAKMALDMGYSVVGLPFVEVFHY